MAAGMARDRTRSTLRALRRPTSDRRGRAVRIRLGARPSRQITRGHPWPPGPAGSGGGRLPVPVHPSRGIPPLDLATRGNAKGRKHRVPTVLGPALDARRVVAIFRTLDEARSALAKRRTQVSEHEFVPDSKLTLAEYLPAWIESYQGKRGQFRESTRQSTAAQSSRASFRTSGKGSRWPR
jgi:hypothetical protein